MKTPRSMFGIVLVLVYLTVAAFGYISTITCGGELCLGAMFVVMPWPFVIGDWWDNMYVYVALLIINSGILYLVGAGIGNLFRKTKSTDQTV